METLSQLITNTHFATYHLNNSTVPIYALAQCHQDLSQIDCLLCYAASRTKIPRCLPSVSGRIYLDGCFLRYDKYDFFQEAVSPSLDAVKCSQGNVSGSGDENGKLKFVTSVSYAVANASSKAVENGGFAAVGIEGVYALAQCWESIDKDGCRACLEKAEEEVKGCLPGKEGRGMNSGCYLRYSTDKFFDHEAELGHAHGFSALGVTIAIALAAAAFIMLSLFAAYATYRRLLKKKTSFNKSSLNFKYETLEKATDYFNPSKKIGQGGAGSVFVGTLPNGQTVAVKRLIFNTRQWVDEFFNEGVYGSGYLIRGQLTEKADVYSFGVLVLEIVMGKRCNSFIEDSRSLLQTVWLLYRTNRLEEAVDPCLRDDFPVQEASRVLQIGLLCTQASVSLRPSMAEVVGMLNSSDHSVIPLPNQPPFMNATLLEPESSTRSCSTNGFVSKAATKVESYSYTSSESSSMNSSDRPLKSEESTQTNPD
ncbi:hypothetical protein GH714_041695 [Hevea brasiliensis]|uniref:Gnk2-homologous domain-containing protein n=1 Tax=Hevea brasiliensis TaxID=3981 RepID=A0A6A6MT23_HEVBR|nr:hypothetical protein GH714_041695 [Hevea brasiliensis]